MADGLADVADLAEYFRTGLFEDSVYVLTPQGRVIDLPQGATPVDFAYHVHTELGHRCRGARVDGEMVPLSYRLANGQTVEIVAAKSGGPSRDWLNPELGIHPQLARASQGPPVVQHPEPGGRHRPGPADRGDACCSAPA